MKQAGPMNNLMAMTYTTAQAREQLLRERCPGDRRDRLRARVPGRGVRAARRTERRPARGGAVPPVQVAYGRAQRTYNEFAARHEPPGSEVRTAPSGAPSHGVKGFLDGAVDGVARADGTLATLQDSMLPVEVGDPELRAGLEEVRKLLGEVPGRARQFVRTLGR